jgi:hypothetical protein
MSTLEVNKLAPLADNGTVTLGDSGDTITVPSGVTITNNGTQTGFGGENTPAFSARMSDSQSNSSGTNTKVNFDTEDFDTDGAYDTSNKRFTVPSGKAGKYFVHIHTIVDDGTTASFHAVTVYKNGSISAKIGESTRTFSAAGDFSISCSGVIDLAVGDYIEAYVYLENSTAIVATFSGSRSVSNFTAYRLIGA